jgi:hypothetical protein
LDFSASSGEKQKHGSASNVALATGCLAPGFYGKKSKELDLGPLCEPRDSDSF